MVNKGIWKSVQSTHKSRTSGMKQGFCSQRIADDLEFSGTFTFSSFLSFSCFSVRFQACPIIFLYTVNLQRALKNEVSASTYSHISYIKEITVVINVETIIKVGLSCRIAEYEMESPDINLLPTVVIKRT